MIDIQALEWAYEDTLDEYRYARDEYKYHACMMPPNYPVPAIALEVLPVVCRDTCIAIDIIERYGNGAGVWPVVASFERHRTNPDDRD